MMLKRQLLFLISIALLAASISQAQSGRRSSSGSTTTTTTTTTNPTTPTAKSPEKKPETAPRLQLLVGIDRSNAFTSTPFYVYDTVLESCIKRLGEADIVFATSAGNNMSRGQAVKAAKEETTRWVVSLEVRSFFAESGRQIKPEQDELYVEYTVIEPATGKIKRSGRTSRHIYQNGRGGTTVPVRNGPGYSEYSIREAAQEAADKILAGFDIKVLDSVIR